MRTLALLPLLAGCFQVTSRPSCERIATEVADDEVTALGTAQELLDGLEALDVVTRFTDEDGAELPGFVHAERAAGPALFVEQIASSEETRSFGFGRNSLMIHVECADTLEVPVAVDAGADDGSVDLTADGIVSTIGPFPRVPEATASVWAEGDFASAVFPTMDHDPRDWEEKYTFVSLELSADELLHADIGWGGVSADGNSSSAAYAMSYSAPAE